MKSEHETDHVERELSELLDELRVILPGVQVLFAFLLTVPFTQRFTDVTTPLLRNVYFATLLCSALSTIMLIAPSAQHRVLSRHHSRDRRLRTGTALLVAGSVFLALAITGVLFLVTHVLFGLTAASAAASGAGGLCVVCGTAFPCCGAFVTDECAGERPGER